MKKLTCANIRDTVAPVEYESVKEPYLRFNPPLTEQEIKNGYCYRNGTKIYLSYASYLDL